MNAYAELNERYVSSEEYDEDIDEREWDELSFRERHFLFNGLFDLNAIVLFRVSGKACRKVRKKCRFLAPLLTVLTVPAVIAAVIARCSAGPLDGEVVSAVCEFSLWFLSLFMHEMGHLIASIGYGYYDPEGVDVGLLLFSVCPVGMYVQAGEDYLTDRNRTNRIVFLFSGCAVNLILASVCFLIACKTGSPVCARLADINFSLGIFNLLPLYALDGDKIIGALMGLDDMLFVSFVLQCLRSKRCRKKMRSSLKGVLIGLFFAAVALLQVFLILSLLLTPLWFDSVIRGEDSVLYRLIDRIFDLYYRLYDHHEYSWLRP